MTAFDRFDARMHDALDDLASPQFPDYFDDVLAEAVAHRQRPGWTFPERWIPMSTLARRSVLVPPVPWRTIGIALLLLALLVATAVVSFGMRRNPAPPFGPAANGRVAYVVDGDIYSRDLATGEVQLVVGGPEVDVRPLFSRDGLSLAWGRFPQGENDRLIVMVARADGSGARALFGPMPLDSAAWSPTSDSLALISGVGGERTLSIVPTVGDAEPVVIDDLPFEPIGFVEWRPPNGDELIFTGAYGGIRAIFGVRADGSDVRQISERGRPDSYWSPYEITPDGSRLLFTHGGEHVGIGVMDLETGDVQEFGAALPDLPGYDGTDVHFGSPSLLPDGVTIVFGRYWNEQDGLINHQMWAASIDGDGADAVPIGPVHRSQAGHNPFWQAVAPDGRSVLIVENDTREAWLADPDGDDPRPVDLGEVVDVPSWQRLAP